MILKLLKTSKSFAPARPTEQYPGFKAYTRQQMDLFHLHAQVHTVPSDTPCAEQGCDQAATAVDWVETYSWGVQPLPLCATHRGDRPEVAR
ncbi:MAG TPA: hypothetical protein VIS06_12035 [Mycobacteriales bacterium]